MADLEGVRLIAVENFFNFMHRFGATCVELNRLLGTRFRPGDAGNATQMGLALERTLLLFNEGRHGEADWELSRMLLLVQALQRIEATAPDILERLARRLVSHDARQYFGTLCEVATAATLLTGGEKLDHESRGGPDFVLKGSAVGVECTSAHVAASLAASERFVIEPKNPGELDLSRKLVQTIHGKAKKPYAVSNVALAIDATNLFALSGSEQPDITPAEAAIETSGFGALLITVVYMNLDGETSIERSYLRRDASTIDPALRDCLDRHWPSGGSKVVERYATPLIP